MLKIAQCYVGEGQVRNQSIHGGGLRKKIYGWFM